MTFSAEQKRRAAESEVVMRKRVYVRLVEDGRMTRELADRKIAVMAEIAADYAELEKQEKLL